MEKTNVSLVCRLRSRNDAYAWDEFVEIYRPWLLKWVRRCVAQPSDAEDVLQEVLAVVVRDISVFDHNGQTGAFRKWLRLILVHRTRDYWRKQPRELQNDSSQFKLVEELADDASQGSQIWNQEHNQYVVRKLLDHVANEFEPTTWQVFEAFVFEEQSASAVAKKFGVSEGSVWTTKSRVMKRLRAVADVLLD